jgi:hypothetical protein
LAGKIIDHDLAVSSLFYLLAPGLSQLALNMAGWEEIAVGKLHGTGFNVGYANHAENKPNADKRKDYERFSRHFGFSFCDKNLKTFRPIQCSVLFFTSLSKSG